MGMLQQVCELRLLPTLACPPSTSLNRDEVNDRRKRPFGSASQNVIGLSLNALFLSGNCEKSNLISFTCGAPLCLRPEKR